MLEELVGGVLAGDRRSLAKAITLVESSHADHQTSAQKLVEQILPRSGNALRIGISGVPGAGKSTFIESLGLTLIKQGRRLAVLAVDPTSSRSGGSILGDKTRMECLSRDPNAFIRPSPSGGALGGVAARTREAMLVCEAAGFDAVIVETVGVGQSEAAVANLTDQYVLLHLPNSGDELQAMKRGVLELADIIVVNKADLDREAALRSAAQIEHVLHASRSHDENRGPEILLASALTGDGVDTVCERLVSRWTQLQASGQLEQKRRSQALSWMWTLIEEGLRHRFHAHPAVRTELETLQRQVTGGQLSPTAAAQQLLDLMDRR